MKRIVLRLLAVLFGLLLAFLIIEIGLRVAYHSLPANLQIALRDVRITPFSDDRLAPPPLWRSDNHYLTIVAPDAKNSLQAGSPDVLFHVTSYSWWNGRVGFRSPQPQDGTVQAVALGDSFTFCFTELENCWVTLVSQTTGLKIANLGQPVTGSVGHARIYQDFVGGISQLKQPQVVLWEFYGNDYNDDYGLARLEGTAKTPPPADSAPPADPDSPFKLWLRTHSMVYALISSLVRGPNPGVEMFVDPYWVQKDGLDLAFGQSYIRDAFDMTQARNLEGEDLSHQAMLQTRDKVEQNGGKFVIIVMPTKEEVYRAITEPLMGKAAVDAIAAPRERLLTFCQAQNLTCFDLLAPLQAQNNQQLYYATDPHLNEAGNKVAAAAISNFLRDQGITK